MLYLHIFNVCAKYKKTELTPLNMINIYLVLLHALRK